MHGPHEVGPLRAHVRHEGGTHLRSRASSIAWSTKVGRIIFCSKLAKSAKCIGVSKRMSAACSQCEPWSA